MKKQIVVKYKVKNNGNVEVKRIGYVHCKKNEIVYFDFEDFLDNVGQLVEDATGEFYFSMKKVLF